MDRDALDAGRAFERQVAKMLNADLVPGSGNQWFAKLDLGRRKLVFSLKWTGKKSFTVTRALIDEIRHALIAPGGLGSDWTGALIVEIDGHAYVLMRLEDMHELLQDDKPVFQMRRSAERRARANRSLLLDE